MFLGSVPSGAVFDTETDAQSEHVGGSSRGNRKGLVVVEGMRVVTEYADLYKRIFDRFGRLESTVMLGPVRGTLVTFTSELLSAINSSYFICDY